MIEPPVVNSFVILGLTRNGRKFRPSDWAERLCGVLAVFRPAEDASSTASSGSSYVVAGLRDGVKCVTVDARLYQLEPLAYKFAAGFAADNDLQVIPLDQSP